MFAAGGTRLFLAQLSAQLVEPGPAGLLGLNAIQQEMERLPQGCRRLAVQLRLNLAPEWIWEVLTDYNNLSQFIPNLLYSRQLWRQGSVVGLEQEGAQQFIGLRFRAKVELPGPFKAAEIALGHHKGEAVLLQVFGELELHTRLEAHAHERLRPLLLEAHHVGPAPHQPGALEVGDEAAEAVVIGEHRPDRLGSEVESQLHGQPTGPAGQTLHLLLNRVEHTSIRLRLITACNGCRELRQRQTGLIKLSAQQLNALQRMRADSL